MWKFANKIGFFQLFGQQSRKESHQNKLNYFEFGGWGEFFDLKWEKVEKLKIPNPRQLSPLTIAKIVYISCLTDISGLLQSNISQTCTKSCLYLTLTHISLKSTLCFKHSKELSWNWHLGQFCQT